MRFFKKDKEISLDMVQELVESNRALRAENKCLRKYNKELSMQNTDLYLENFRLKHIGVKCDENTIPGILLYAEMRNNKTNNIASGV